jgi:hypothetical protein
MSGLCVLKNVGGSSGDVKPPGKVSALLKASEQVSTHTLKWREGLTQINTFSGTDA